MTDEERIDFYKSRIKLYRSYAGKKDPETGKRIYGLWRDEGNIRMAEQVIREYKRLLKGVGDD